MSDKYIIKNCPAWQPHEVHYCYNSGNTRICPVYKDCILKQIVELCRKAPILDADWILNKLDIQEVE